MGTPEFPDLGRHCSVNDCNQIDFLPFTCDHCGQIFCLEHRSYTGHSCPNAKQNDVTVLVCPLCARGVRLASNEDPNIAWENHANRDCDPSNYQKANRRERCPVPGCRELLTLSNNVRCKDCTKAHCLKHRFGPDHKCPGPPPKQDSVFPFIGALRKNSKADSKATKSDGSSWWGSGILNAASSVRASAEAGMLKLSSMTSQTLQAARDGNSQGLGFKSPQPQRAGLVPKYYAKKRDGNSQGGNSGAIGEQCLQCTARFPSAAALAEHVERCHTGSYKRNQNSWMVDICPKCKKVFHDPVLLVQHVERDHGGSSIS